MQDNQLTLYGITEEYRNLMEMLEESEGELTPELEEALTINQEQFESKSYGYSHVIRYYHGLANSIDEEIARLTRLKKYAANSESRLKESLLKAMQLYNIKSLKFPIGSIYLSKSTQTVIENPEAIPESLCTVKIEPSKTKIKEALNQGQAVPGAYLKESQFVVLR